MLAAVYDATPVVNQERNVTLIAREPMRGQLKFLRLFTL